MAIIDKYESVGNIPGVEYICFFCDMPEQGDEWTEMIQFIRDDTFKSGTGWCLANTQIRRDEIEQFAHGLETSDYGYTVASGWSVNCESFEEMLGEFRDCEFKDAEEIEPVLYDFFGM